MVVDVVICVYKHHVRPHGIKSDCERLWNDILTKQMWTMRARFQTFSWNVIVLSGKWMRWSELSAFVSNRPTITSDAMIRLSFKFSTHRHMWTNNRRCSCLSSLFSVFFFCFLHCWCSCFLCTLLLFTTSKTLFHRHRPCVCACVHFAMAQVWPARLRERGSCVTGSLVSVSILVLFIYYIVDSNATPAFWS